MNWSHVLRGYSEIIMLEVYNMLFDRSTASLIMCFHLKSSYTSEFKIKVIYDGKSRYYNEHQRNDNCKLFLLV